MHDGNAICLLNSIFSNFFTHRESPGSIDDRLLPS
nr:MAG TPA_asm: Nucleoside diphosphate kinase 3 [Caudoviricetes sp.]